jgi:hypothetical protein
MVGLNIVRSHGADLGDGVLSVNGKSIAPSHGYPSRGASGAGEAHPELCPQL